MKRILIVEDDPHNALLFRRLLERRGGFEVHVTESAEEVIARAEDGRADLVIMDVSLANTHLNGQPVSGIDLCLLLKQSPRTASLPVVLATAHAMRGDAEMLVQQSGADGYVAKPILDHRTFLDHILSFLKEAA